VGAGRDVSEVTLRAPSAEFVPHGFGLKIKTCLSVSLLCFTLAYILLISLFHPRLKKSPVLPPIILFSRLLTFLSKVS